VACEPWTHLVALNVDHTWDNATATQGKLDTFQPNHRSGRSLRGRWSDTGPTGASIIRNSWGTGWGDKGFAYASEAYIQCGVLQRELRRDDLS